jgi:hypothetical protein
MTKNGSVRSILLALIAVLFGCGTLSGCRERIYLSKEEVEASIGKEIPPGSSVEQVKAFVNSYSQRFETNVTDYEEPVPQPSSRCAPNEKLTQAQGYIWGGMRRTGTAPQHMAYLNIRLCFYFDKNRTLVGHKVEQIETY